MDEKVSVVERFKMRTGYASVDAICPFDGGKWNVLVSPQRIAFINKIGGAFRYESRLIVPAVLKKPAAIFEGVRRDEDENKGSDVLGWLAYLGYCECGYGDDGAATEPPGDPYLVFVDEERVAYNWRFDEDDLLTPDVFEHRFRKKLL